MAGSPCRFGMSHRRWIPTLHTQVLHDGSFVAAAFILYLYIVVVLMAHCVPWLWSDRYGEDERRGNPRFSNLCARRQSRPERGTAAIGSKCPPSPTAAEYVVEFRNVSKWYSCNGKGKEVALDGLSLKIPRGKFVAIIGDSGGGKSSTLHLAALLDRPSSGNVYLLGYDVGRLSHAQRSRLRGEKLGLIFQDYKNKLLSSFSVQDNIILPLILAGIPAGEREQRFEWVMGQVNLPPNYGTRFPAELSGGEQQRVAIARALVRNPEVVLADEPSGHLDPKNTRNILDLLKGLTLRKEGAKTVVWVTHNRENALAYADYIVVLRAGRILAEEARGPQGFSSGFQQKVTEAFASGKELT